MMFIKETLRFVDKTVFGGLVLALFGAGFYQGIQQFAVQLDIAFLALKLVWIDAAFAALGFTATVLVFGVLSLWTLSRESLPEPATDGGDVTAIVPVYQDANVLHKSVESLKQCGYDHLSICIVCEPDDLESIEAAQQYASDDNVTYLVNNRYPGSKAGAINYAAEETDDPYIAVFDADHKVEQQFIGQAVALLQDHEIVQGRGLMNPSGIIESLSYYENTLLIGSMQLLSVVCNFEWAGSTSIVMRTTTFEEVGGYDTDVVTEDYEFAHRCYRNGVDVKRIMTATSVGEPPHTLQDFWHQRKRWILGQFQVLQLLVKNLFSSPLQFRNLLSCTISLSTALGGLFLLMLLPKMVILAALGAFPLLTIPIGALIAFAFLFRTFDTFRGPLQRIGYTWMLAPVAILLFSVVTAKTVPEYVFTWNGDWYHVQKGV